MSRPAIDTARSLIKKRKFSKAITLLEGAYDIYHEVFDYYLLLGTACLYAGDTGNAGRYYQQARHIRLSDTNLLIGQAALFLRRGDTDRAIQYYLEVLENDPSNSIASNAMEFIRTKGSYETIVRWVDTGKIEKFYPHLTGHSGFPLAVFCSVAAVFVAVFAVLYLSGVIRFGDYSEGKRADLSALVLTADEQSGLQEKNLSGGVYRYILTEKQIEASYNNARKYFQSYMDNSSRVEINRLLNSNASEAVKKKAEILLSYLEEPTFDSLSDNITYQTAFSDPVLYEGCWVIWSGRVTNVLTTEELYKCDLLVGYENLERIDGIVSLSFPVSVASVIHGDRPVKVLARIGNENGRIVLTGRSVYQPLGKD